MLRLFKPLFPRSLYGRAALILIVPIVTIQLVVSITFIQRHFEAITRQMTQGVARQVVFVLDELGAGGLPRARAVAGPLALGVDRPVAPPAADLRRFYDLSGREVIATLREMVPGLIAVDLVTGIDRREVRVHAATAAGPALVTLDRRRVSASNPHQLLVLMIFTGALMTLIAYLFLRNQLTPIKRLAEAAEAFGKGRVLPYRPRGAVEVRAAGAAFLDMRARIERQIEQRTLMLSGISHDLRTPLTRMKLGLAMLPEDEDTAALQRDVAEMERMVEEFLAFARGDAMEEPRPVELRALLRRVVDNALRAGGQAALAPGPEVTAPLRPDAVARAVENLLGNALRHGRRAEVSLAAGERSLRITVEDDGPGIPADRRDEAMKPFARLDAARDPNRGGGTGLGLAIAADIARSHGGQLRLSDSARLGGLRADLVLAR